MAKVLVAEDKTGPRDSLVEILRADGYEVVAASNGSEAFELACHERPDIVLLDIWMPVLDGFQVLQRLRENPSTKAIPVVLLTGMDPAQGEGLGMNLGVTHYITKPYSPEMVETAIKVALREGGVSECGVDGEGLRQPQAAPRIIATGTPPIDTVLGGGLPLGSLTLMEGAPAAGKSVLCYYFASSALRAGLGTAYYVPVQAVESAVDGMATLGLEPVPYVRAGQLAFFPMEQPVRYGPESDRGRYLSLLAGTVETLPEQYKVVFLDHITDLASWVAEPMLVDFFTRCRYLCEAGRTIIIVARSYGFQASTLARLEDVCDAHLRVGSDRVGARLVKVLEVCKVRNTTMTRNNVVNFDVDPGEGLRVVPGAKVRV